MLYTKECCSLSASSSPCPGSPLHTEHVLARGWAVSPLLTGLSVHLIQTSRWLQCKATGRELRLMITKNPLLLCKLWCAITWELSCYSSCALPLCSREIAEICQCTQKTIQRGFFRNCSGWDGVGEGGGPGSLCLLNPLLFQQMLRVLKCQLFCYTETSRVGVPWRAQPWLVLGPYSDWSWGHLETHCWCSAPHRIGL